MNTYNIYIYIIYIYMFLWHGIFGPCHNLPDSCRSCRHRKLFLNLCIKKWFFYPIWISARSTLCMLKFIIERGWVAGRAFSWMGEGFFQALLYNWIDPGRIRFAGGGHRFRVGTIVGRYAFLSWKKEENQDYISVSTSSNQIQVYSGSKVDTTFHHDFSPTSINFGMKIKISIQDTLIRAFFGNKQNVGSL